MGAPVVACTRHGARVQCDIDLVSNGRARGERVRHEVRWVLLSVIRACLVFGLFVRGECLRWCARVENPGRTGRTGGTLGSGARRCGGGTFRPVANIFDTSRWHTVVSLYIKRPQNRQKEKYKISEVSRVQVSRVRTHGARRQVANLPTSINHIKFKLYSALVIWRLRVHRI